MLQVNLTNIVVHSRQEKAVRIKYQLGSVKKLHHPGTREGGVSEKMILDYVGGGRGIAKDDG